MDFRAINNYAYVTIKDTAADLHFRIYDLGDPLYAGYAPKTHPDFDTDRVTFLNASDNFVFSRGSGLVTFDAAALDNINAVNRIDTFEVDELVFKGDYIFAIGSLNPNIGFSIIDFSDPSNATILRSFELESTGINFSFPGNPCPSSPLSQKYSNTDNLVLIPATDAVSIIDITDPINANEVKRVDMENTLNAIFIYGDHAYVTTATGLSIIDISNPVSAEVGGGPQNLDSVLSSDSDPEGRIRDEQEAKEAQCQIQG
jgi:hypothetical protein